MYTTLWNFIKKHTKASHTTPVFLTALTVGWAVIGLLAGTVACMLVTVSSVTKLTILFCTCGYAGLVPGFLGGICCLYKITFSHKAHTKSSEIVKPALH